ncbi:hypothetical protein ACTFIW_002776 [Dictyostelium discoideum]
MNYLKIFLFVFFTILVSRVGSMRLNGGIYPNTPFTQYIGKFCFKDNGGFIIADINWDHYNISSIRLLLFSDSMENVVERVESLSCNKTVTPTHELNIKSSFSGFFKVIKGQGDRYWYLVIQNCEKYPSNLKYDVSLFNEGDSYYKFLSADHQSVPHFHLFYFLLDTVLILFSFKLISKSKINEINDWVIVYLTDIMFLSLISIFIYTLNWLYLILDLPPFKNFYGIANLIYILSKNLFFLLLIYVGQSWTTSIYYKSKIRKCFNLFLIVINFSLGWSLSYTFDYSKQDIKPFNYYLNCFPGYLWYVTNGSLTVYFIYCNIISYRSLKDDEVIAKTFLKIYTLVFSIYILSPILVGIISHFFPEYIKFQVSTIMNHTFDFIF